VPEQLVLDALEGDHLKARAPEPVEQQIGRRAHFPVESRCLGISFWGSMNGIVTTVAATRPVGT
jgi:hypothetical protein